MPRKPRITTGDTVYHVLNRGNARLPIFEKEKDYQNFEKLLWQAKQEVIDVPILAYCLMPNHWHLLLYPKNDRDLTLFMQWIGQTHTARWHLEHKSVGTGHLYQGRFKSFPVENDMHFLTVCRYVERNALRANLVKKAQDWKWSSVYRREAGTLKEKMLLSEWPTEIPKDYLAWLNEPQTEEELEALRRAVNFGKPYGSEEWQRQWDEKME